MVIVFSAAALLGGCVAGPAFQSPAGSEAANHQFAMPRSPTTSSANPGGAAQHFDTNAKIQADWYTLFKSPALDALIRRALAHSPTLQASQASLHEAAFQLESISGVNLPSVDASSDASRQKANGARIGLDNPLFNNVFNLYGAQVSLGYHLDLFGKSARETEAQAARVGYQEDLLRGSALTLVDNLVTTAIHYATLRDRLAATQSIVRAERRQAKLLAGQEKMGAVARADVLRARAELADTEALLPDLRHEIAIATHALAELAGEDPVSFRSPPLSLSRLTLPARLPVSLPSQLVRQRPDIRAAEQMLHVANAEVGVATANLYPEMNLTASFGSAANHADDILKAPAEVWSLAAGITAPLFHGGSLRAKRKAAKAQWEVQYARYRETVLSAFSQVADVLDAIVQDAASLKARDHALEANKESLELVEKQYKAGAASYLDVLTAQQRYDKALIARIDAAGRRYADTAALYHALGGGWWNLPGGAGASKTNGGTP